MVVPVDFADSARGVVDANHRAVDESTTVIVGRSAIVDIASRGIRPSPNDKIKHEYEYKQPKRCPKRCLAGQRHYCQVGASVAWIGLQNVCRITIVIYM